MTSIPIDDYQYMHKYEFAININMIFTAIVNNTKNSMTVSALYLIHSNAFNAKYTKNNNIVAICG